MQGPQGDQGEMGSGGDIGTMVRKLGMYTHSGINSHHHTQPKVLLT